MDEKKTELLGNAGNVFMRYGIRSVTMDDVAKELKISKKTIYKYVSDKKDLVKQVMQAFTELERCEMTQYCDGSKDAIEELVKMTKHVSRTLSEIHPSIHFDLEKYYPGAKQVFDQHRDVFVYKCVLANLERGIEEGLYRDNIQPEILAKLYVQKIDMVFDSEIFPPSEYRFEDIYMEYIRYHIRGIASKEGIKKLKNIIDKEKINM